jgi:glycosyltransferase involved in cell wall biosynthesis
MTTDGSEKPKYSIIVANYNYGRFLGNAIGSVLSQTFTNWEAILIDDCSTDNSLLVIDAISDKRVRKVLHKENCGNISSFNEGIDLAKGEYVSILSSDDMYSDDFLENVDLFFRENPTAGMVYSNHYIIDQEGRKKRVIKNRIHHRDGLFQDEIVPLLYGCHIPNCATVVPKSVLNKVGKYRPIYQRTGDWELWMRIASAYPVGFIGKPLYQYRIHGGNMSVSVDTQLKVIDETETLLNQMFSTPGIRDKIQKMEPKVRNYHQFASGLRLIKSNYYRDGLKKITEALKGDPLILFRNRNSRDLLSAFAGHLLK